MLYTLRFFSLQNAVCFIKLTCLVPVLSTFYTQNVLKLKKKNNSGAKGLRLFYTIHLAARLMRRSQHQNPSWSIVPIYWVCGWTTL